MLVDAYVIWCYDDVYNAICTQLENNKVYAGHLSPDEFASNTDASITFSRGNTMFTVYLMKSHIIDI